MGLAAKLCCISVQDMLACFRDKDVLMFAAASKCIRATIQSHCGASFGRVTLVAGDTGEGPQTSGLWRHFPLWEVGMCMSDLSFISLLDGHVLGDKREVRTFSCAAHRALRETTRHYTWSCEHAEGCAVAWSQGKCLSIFLVKFAFKLSEVEECLGGDRLDATAVARVPQLGTSVALRIRSPFAYPVLEYDQQTRSWQTCANQYEMDLLGEDQEMDYKLGTRALWVFATWGNDFEIEVSYDCAGEWSGGCTYVTGGDRIDQMVRLGKPVPLLLAVRSVPKHEAWVGC
mmetsp:Transcript_32916/g.61680  ORF Transcript_32916/g.61680 Transcript_32916/m.61680 type:complete len:287 (-) Transcript_32916:58-918(-)